LLCRDFGYTRAGERPRKDKDNGSTSGALDWAALVENIRKGHALHDSLRDLAGKLVTAGMDGGAATNFLRGLMDGAECAHDERWQSRRDDIPRLVQTAEKPKQESFHHYADITRDPIPPRPWLVHERIPGRNVMLLSGEGAIGKSILLLQLSTAGVLGGRDWIGTRPTAGPAIYLNCEDEEEEICRRLEDIAKHYGVTRKDIAGQLHVMSLVGRDALLGLADRSERIQKTPLFDQLRKDALTIKPRLIVIDTVADVFGGRENDRSQTRQFITLMRGLALEADCAVILASHPSLTGIASDTGLSGNTAWHNSVRARAYFKAAPEVDDPTLRILEWRKNNYGPPMADSILLRWQSGLYVLEPQGGSFEQTMADAKADNLFLELLRRFATQGRNVTDKKGTSYAPAIFADEPEAKAAKATNKALAGAMRRLFASNKIRLVNEGPASRQRTRLMEM
jgi:RecA-family ATPase